MSEAQFSAHKSRYTYNKLMYSAFTFRVFNSDYTASNKGYFNENNVINDRIGDGILPFKGRPCINATVRC